MEADLPKDMPDEPKKTHRLQIYLIKKGISEDIILGEEYPKKNVGIGTLFYKQSSSHQPQWLELFQRDGYGLEGVYAASASALLLVKAENRFFAIAFGHGGRHMLLPGVYEERFGLLVTLNAVDPKSIRSVDTKTLESEPMQTREQASRGTETNRFTFDPESDLVRAFTGTPAASENLGSMLVGKDALKISIRTELNDIKALLKILLKKFGEKKYIENGFDWIDQMKELQDSKLIETLNGKMVAEFNKASPSKLWLTVPDIIDWDDVAGFKYSQKKTEDLKDDLHIQAFKDFIDKEVTLEDLENHRVHMHCSSTENDKEKWKVYDCVYCECDNDGSTYLLSNGRWYAINKKLVDKVNSAFGKIPKKTTAYTFPDYNHDSEGAYNKAICDGRSAICFDAQPISYGGSYSKIEFCDVYTTSKKMIHVKRYSGSSTLSHLFNQGANAAEALLDTEFRAAVNKKLSSANKINSPNNPRESMEVVFGIVSKSEKDLDIPFFSKMSLKHVASRLQNLGYKVSLVKIKNAKDGEQESD